MEGRCLGTLGGILADLGHPVSGAELLAEAERLAREVGDAEGLELVALRRGHVALAQGALGELGDRLQRAEEAAARSAEVRLALRVLEARRSR